MLLRLYRGVRGFIPEAQGIWAKVGSMRRCRLPAERLYIVTVLSIVPRQALWTVPGSCPRFARSPLGKSSVKTTPQRFKEKSTRHVHPELNLNLIV